MKKIEKEEKTKKKEIDEMKETLHHLQTKIKQKIETLGGVLIIFYITNYYKEEELSNVLFTVAVDEIQTLEEIGHGTFGIVYKGNNILLNCYILFY